MHAKILVPNNFFKMQIAEFLSHKRTQCCQKCCGLDFFLRNEASGDFVSNYSIS